MVLATTGTLVHPKVSARIYVSTDSCRKYEGRDKNREDHCPEGRRMLTSVDLYPV
jgi:hypothetical protein